MKRIYASMIALFLVNEAIGQTNEPCVPCLPQGITFTTQAQIDSFQINYSGCTEIEGGVSISGGDITNINGLNVLTSIGGDLYIISGTIALTSLTGLESLTSIGGGLYIYGATALTSLTGLESLTSIGLDLSIGANYTLTSLTGLEGLTAIGNNLVIGGASTEGNPALISLTSLNNLTYIGGALQISNNGLLSNCAVEGICEYLADPNGMIYIQYNATGCASLQEVEDACEAIGVESLTPLSTLTIFPNPTSTAITIETPSKGSLSIHNSSGQQQLQFQITEQTTTIDVSGLKSGVYLVKVVGEKGVQVGKFVKQ